MFPANQLTGAKTSLHNQSLGWCSKTKYN